VVDSLTSRLWRHHVRPTLVHPVVLAAAAAVFAVATAGVGLSLPIAVAFTLGVYAAIAGASVFTGPPPALTGGRKATSGEVTRGTPQAQALEVFNSYRAALTGLWEARTLPDSVSTSGMDALVAADGSLAAVERTAASVDRIDASIARARGLAQATGNRLGGGSLESLRRMEALRASLLGRLDQTVAQVADVHTKLLELAARADAAELTDQQFIGEVNRDLDELSASFTSLEEESRRKLPS
jgi:hypothetical protein